MSTVGRNDLCPCGSGKKYKKCCLPQETARLPRTAAEETSGESFTAEVRRDLDKAVDRVLERLEGGERQGLEAEFQALVRENPNYHMTNYAMGVYMAMVQQDHIGAIPFFEKAIRVFPPLAEAHFNLGNCYCKAARMAQAVAAYRQAIRYSDGGDGIDRMAQKELRALERIIRDTTQFKTLDAFVENQKLFDLAFEDLRKRDYEKAVERFSKVLEQNPRHVQSYGNLALAHAGLGQKAAAMKCFDQALALDPSYEPALVNRKLLETMNEGEPHIPRILAETEYYRDRLDAERSQTSSWWQKVKLWRAG